MSGEFVLAAIGVTGTAVTVLVTLFQFLNTRKSVKSKGSADSYQAYQQFVNGASDDRDRELSRLKTERDKLWIIRAALIDIIQDLIALLRNKNARPDELEPYQDKLDAVRAM